MTDLFREPEKRAMFDAMVRHFKPCSCTEEGERPIVICEGHRFLQEPDRIGHLLFVRRMAQHWIDGEWMGETPPTREPEPTEVEAPPAPPILPW